MTSKQKVWGVFIMYFAGPMAIYLFAVYFGDYLRNQNTERRAAEKAACQANPTCRDRTANNEARSKSFSSPAPVPSSTGLVYFKGAVCMDDCSGHVAGYEWAELRGISKDAGCTKGSLSFLKGCRQYVEERKSELENNGSESDERESCTPGRYGDC